jgi:hypothetical protein
VTSCGPAIYGGLGVCAVPPAGGDPRCVTTPSRSPGHRDRLRSRRRSTCCRRPCRRPRARPRSRPIGDGHRPAHGRRRGAHCCRSPNSSSRRCRGTRARTGRAALRRCLCGASGSLRRSASQRRCEGTRATRPSARPRWAAALAKQSAGPVGGVGLPTVRREVTHEAEGALDPRRRHVADRHRHALVEVLYPELLGHGGGKFDAGHGDASSCERQGRSAGADGDLESGAVACEFGQHVDRRGDDVGVELRDGALVVARGDVLAEVPGRGKSAPSKRPGTARRVLRRSPRPRRTMLRAPVSPLRQRTRECVTCLQPDG